MHEVSDYSVLQWMDLRARVVGCHPLNLKFHEIVSPATVVDILRSADGRCSNPTINSFCTRFGGLSARHSNLSIRLRALFLLHFNDILSALLPLVYDGNTSAGENVSSASDDVAMSLGVLLQTHRDIILTEVLYSPFSAALPN